MLVAHLLITMVTSLWPCLDCALQNVREDPQEFRVSCLLPIIIIIIIIIYYTLVTQS